MIYAIGDIHGNYKMLAKMYNTVYKHIKDVDDPFGAKIVFLGDYIDRGKQNFKVINFLDNLKDNDELEHIFILGNHEQMFVDAEYDRNTMRMWFENGGDALYEELIVNPNKPQMIFDTNEYKYIKKFIKNKTIKLYNDVDYVFVHGAYNKNVPEKNQDTNFLIWGRMKPEFYDDCHKMVIHGHTPTKDYKPYKYNNVVNVDIGCGFRNQLGCVALPHVRDDTKIEFIVVRG